MNKERGFYLFFFCFVMLFLCSGCAILQLPVKMVDGTFSILHELLKIGNSLPKPPPWIF